MTEHKDFDKKKINDGELQKYSGSYSEEGLLHKISRYGAHIGIELLYKAVQLWCVLQKPEVPAKEKALIMGALGYLIAPLDFVPDLTPVLGYSDDLVAITFALLKVQGYIDEEVDAKAKELLAKVLIRMSLRSCNCKQKRRCRKAALFFMWI